MNDDYYGPTATAAQEVNRLLSIAATGWEQDWEIEFADPSRIEQMLDILESQQLGRDSKAALCLLAIASFESAFDASGVDADCIRRTADLLRQDAVLHKQMRFYWLDLGRSNYPDLMRKLLSI